MRGFSATRWLGAIALGCMVLGAPSIAGPGHDHGPAGAPKAAAAGPSLSLASEAFELAGRLTGGRLTLRLTGKATNAAVIDAQIEVSIDGETVRAEAQPDGSYAVKTPALDNPGPHEVIATITAGKVSDLLVGTLDAAAHAHGAEYDHDHASHHQDTGGRILDYARQPLVAAGLALFFTLLGAGITAHWRSSSSRHAKPLLGGALAVAAAVLTAGMFHLPATEKQSPGGHAGYGWGGHARHEQGGEKPEGQIDMPPERIAAAQITIAKVIPGALVKKLTVPGVIIPDSSKQARVPAQVVGTVAEMRKGIGDQVARGEVIAVISSREVADAKSDYLTAVVNLELQKTLFERSQVLWDKRVTPEQQYLQVKATYTQAELRLDLARQKLSSLGLDAKVVASEAKEDGASHSTSRLRTYEVRSPMAGRIVERKVDVGAPVGKEGDASELYIIADLSTVWVELAVPLGDLNAIKERQRITIRHDQTVGAGTIVFVSPMVNAETRSARAIAAVENHDLIWRPGTFVSAEVASAAQDVAVRVPRTAVQTIEGKQVVFVRTSKGFEKRVVSVGKSDDEAVEVVSGLASGEAIAVSNTFLLKADLGKAEAEHSH